MTAARHSAKRKSIRGARSLISVVPDFPIVGVGASAGGFEAFIELLQALPSQPKLAIIFVQHLAPNHGSALADLLAGYTSLVVSEAREGVRVAPNNLYVAPPQRADGARRRPPAPLAETV